MFRKGAIRKIEMRNFVTYTHMEIFPSPGLNLLVGPNGSGKSTVVAAIILGLGGNPKIVGRGNKISEYVKHNCDEASITIYIQGEGENDTIRIGRTFNLQDRNIWSINRKQVNLKQLLEYIKPFNIQVDNLCQFLPQDRVQSFAKMNQKELLVATQEALCRADLIEYQQKLINRRSHLKELLDQTDKNAERLGSLIEANKRLEGKITGSKTKKRYVVCVQDIERKMAWVRYDKHYERLNETKDDVKKATECFEKYRKKLQPMEKEIDSAKRLVTELQQNNTANTRQWRMCETTVRNSLDKIQELKRKIRTYQAEMADKLSEIDQRNHEIRVTITKTDELKATHTKLIESCGTEDVVKKLDKLNAEMAQLRSHINKLQMKREELLENRTVKNRALEMIHTQLQKVENIKNQRLEYLRRFDEHAYRATMWLRENRNLFEDEVFEPMMLEINVINAKNSIYPENVISVRDQVAFTCVSKNDMNLLIRSLREQLHLNVNILHAGDPGNVYEFQSKIPIEQLKRFGFYTYLKSMITAPDPIMRYLCRNYRIHNIPVGDSTTNNIYDEVPQDIRLFFSDKRRFATNFSKYTGNKTVRQEDIQSTGSLSVSIDNATLDRLQSQMKECNNQIATVSKQADELDNQIRKLNEQAASHDEELKKIRSVRQTAASIQQKMDYLTRKLSELQAIPQRPELIRSETKRKIRGVVEQIFKLQQDLSGHYGSLTEANVKSRLAETKIADGRERVAFLENSMQESQRQCREAEQLLNQVKETYANLKSEARVVLQKAKSLSKNLTPDDDGFQEFRDSYNKLPDDLKQLEEEKARYQSKIDCLNTADDGELEIYETREKQIEELQEEQIRADEGRGKLVKKIETLKENWLVPLGELLDEINRNFEIAFERMSCKGSVSLNKGENEDNYAEYGLCIKVSYRPGEPLQELNTRVQSGGERAVATAAFMLSLQNLTPVPFRCADEINQGMDPDNERRIFEMLVSSTDDTNSSQYFLITPKLVPNLKFSPSVAVHIIHNGPFIDADRKWSASKLCNPDQVQIH